MSNSALISIVIPYYNTRFDFFKEAIDSMLAQSYLNWEAIIVNDGSTLQNKNLLEEYIIKINEKRISILHLDKNYGQSIAYNKGIEASKGEIVTWLDSDDILLPWYLQNLIEAFNSNPNCSIVVSHCYIYLYPYKLQKIWINKLFPTLFEGSNGKNRADYILENLKKNKELICPHFTFKKEVFKKIKLDPELKALEDTDLQLQILSDSELLNGLLITPTAGYLYRTYPSYNRVSYKVNLAHKAREKIINKYKDENLFAFKLIKHWQETSENWKFCRYINNYLNNGSIINYLRDTCLGTKSIKDKTQSIKLLVKTILGTNYLLQILGLNLTHIKILALKDNEYSKIKEEFQDYLTNHKDNQVKLYATKVFKEIFSK